MQTRIAHALMILAVVGCDSSLALEEKLGFLAQRISVYVSHYETLPESIAQLNDVFLEEQRAGWDQVIKEITIDPWGNPISYSLLDEGKQYELRSAGADGTMNTDDDIVFVGPDEAFAKGSK